MRKIILLVFILFFASSGNACEKWKGEMTKLAWESGKYYKLYNDFKNQKIGKTSFLLDAEGIVSEINELSDYVNSTSSCSGEKFETRKNRLVSYISKAKYLMRAGEFVMAFEK